MNYYDGGEDEAVGDDDNDEGRKAGGDDFQRERVAHLVVLVVHLVVAN